MDEPAPKPKSLVLILARELASNTAVPLLVVDEAGTLMYYNEPAEAVLGVPFSDAGHLPIAEWAERWPASAPDGRALASEDLPLVIATQQHRPAHLPIRIARPDGTHADIEVTAFPLFAHRDEFVGAVAIFWDL